MRRPLGHLGLILGTASLLFGCPSDDDGSGEGTTGGPTTDPTMTTTAPSTSGPTTTPSTDTSDESSSGEGTGSSSGSGSDSGSTGSESGSGSSSGTASAGGDFILNLIGYQGPHGDQDVSAKLFSEDDREVGEVVGVIDADPYTLTIDGVVQEGVNYNVRWWVDSDESGDCTEGDHMWEQTGEAGTATGLTVDHNHDLNFTNVCAFWR